MLKASTQGEVWGREFLGSPTFNYYARRRDPAHTRGELYIESRTAHAKYGTTVAILIIPFSHFTSWVRITISHPTSL
jgi:hypothetical protein